MPVEKLRHLGHYREELEEFCWSFTEEYLGANQGERIWIFSSNPYFKKKNLTADKAEWSGWEIHARTNLNDFIITVERRKYIPPIMENFCDFILITKLPLMDLDKVGGTAGGTIGGTAGGPSATSEFKMHLDEHREIIDSIEPISSVSLHPNM